MKQMIKEYFAERLNILGYTGTIGLWVTEHFEAAAGMILSATFVIASIALHTLKIRREINQEKRDQEIHELRMKKEK